ncbi:MAG: DUF421 domain-containing protein [Firmicutes bacterium]|nr:DUF421 domain-containing protein [Bacillota bacterium]
MLRLLGKKEMGKLTYSNMASAAALGSLASGLMTDTNNNPIYYIIALIAFPLLTYIIGIISLKSPYARKVFEGEPTLVISHGKILEKNLKHMRLSTDNLMQKLRSKKVFNISDVEFAFMEPEGKISILLDSKNQPVTPKDLNIFVNKSELPITVIKEGTIIEKNLYSKNFTKDWLETQLKTNNISNVSDVFLCQVDSSGSLYVDLKDSK